MGPEDRPFAFARGLHNTVARWLQEVRLLNMMVLMGGLRARTMEWVCCCWLVSLEAALTLADDHLATRLEHPWEQPWPAARDRLVLAPLRRVLGGGGAGPSRETPPVPPVIHSTENFPLKQSRDDTLRSTFDQVMSIVGQMVHPEAALMFPHFVLIRDRLC